MTAKEEEKPLYYGHRARLRERFLADEGASMPDYEILEMMLGYAFPRRDTKPLAKKLIEKYGGMAGVVNAPRNRLREDFKLSDNAIGLIKGIKVFMLRANWEFFSKSDVPIFSVWEQFEDYCRGKLAYKEVEEFWVFLFDSKMNFITEKQISTGTVNKSYAPPREVIRAAIDNKAVKIVLAHNHPSGDSSPSKEDILLTKAIMEAAEIMGMEVFDHLIVTRGSTTSFRTLDYFGKARRAKK